MQRKETRHVAVLLKEIERLQAEILKIKKFEPKPEPKPTDRIWSGKATVSPRWNP